MLKKCWSKISTLLLNHTDNRMFLLHKDGLIKNIIGRDHELVEEVTEACLYIYQRHIWAIGPSFSGLYFLRGHNWMHFSTGPIVLYYIGLNSAILKT